VNIRRTSRTYPYPFRDWNGDAARLVRQSLPTPPLVYERVGMTMWQTYHSPPVPHVYRTPTDEEFRNSLRLEDDRELQRFVQDRMLAYQIRQDKEAAQARARAEKRSKEQLARRMNDARRGRWCQRDLVVCGEDSIVDLCYYRFRGNTIYTCQCPVCGRWVRVKHHGCWNRGSGQAPMAIRVPHHEPIEIDC
jgi:hypothetical protein